LAPDPGNQGDNNGDTYVDHVVGCRIVGQLRADFFYKAQNQAKHDVQATADNKLY